MKVFLCFRYCAIFFFLLSSITNAQTTLSKQEATEFIKDYYTNFQTGYDFDGKYKIISENFKTEFSDSIFILTFDTYRENKNIQNQKVTINLKDILSLEPYGTDVVEVYGNDPFIIPINGKLAFSTENEVFEIPIYYEVDEDVTTSQIYEAFETIWKFHKKEQ